MKTAFSYLLLTTILLASCGKIFSDGDCKNCNKQNISCTEIYKIISVNVKSSKGEAIEVADYKVYFSKDKKNIAPIADLSPYVGVYAIATDGMMDKISCKGSSITFDFTMDNKNWQSHEFVIGKDCCHIELKNDKSLEIII